MISTVDPQTRHGHKTAARGFDGYKGHVGVDPDTEIITATTVTAGNAGDASAAEQLIADLLDNPTCDPVEQDPAERGHRRAGEAGEAGTGGDQACVYGDNAYGTGELQDRLERAGIESKCKTQQPVAAGGMFAKDRFDVDLDADTVSCPAGRTAPIRRGRDGVGAAHFWPDCTHCPLREQCTTAADGRTVQVGIYERQLAAARARQRTRAGSPTTGPPDPRWNARSPT